MTDPTKPHFDGTINLGHIISILAVVVSIAGGWYVFDHRLTSVERQLEKLSTVIIEAVRIDERLKNIDRRLDRLEAK